MNDTVITVGERPVREVHADIQLAANEGASIRLHDTHGAVLRVLALIERRGHRTGVIEERPHPDGESLNLFVEFRVESEAARPCGPRSMTVLARQLERLLEVRHVWVQQASSSSNRSTHLEPRLGGGRP